MTNTQTINMFHFIDNSIFTIFNMLHKKITTSYDLSFWNVVSIEEVTIFSKNPNNYAVKY